MVKWNPPTPEELAEIRDAEQAIARDIADQEARRRTVRLGLHANVTVDSDTNFYTGFTENLSEGGVFISTFSPPEVGEEVALRITVRGEAELVVKGEVKWHRTDEDGSPVGCGVSFRDLSAQQVQVLDSMLGMASRDPLLFEA